MHVIGIASAAFFSVCYIPQIVAILRTKNVSGISVWMWIIAVAGFITGLLYVVWREDPVLVATYTVGLILAATTLLLVLYYRNKQD